jgi:membrane-associated phospholipid phosphatase
MDRTIRILTLALVLTLSGPAYAQAQSIGSEPDPFKWDSHRDLIDWTSTGLVAANLTIDTIHNLRAPDRRRALGCEAARLAFTIIGTEIVKQLVVRLRPDASDFHSFWSEHTAIAAATSGYRFSVGIPIAVGTGYGRMAAARHWPSDVGVGFAVGSFVQYGVCRQ